MLVGYARVSTLDQNLDLQRDALTKAGCERLFEEKKSGKAGTKRPEFEAALAYLRPTDVLVVWKLDRLGRSLVEMMRTIDSLRKNGAMAEYFLDLNRERTMEGLKAALARGRKGGRPKKLTEADIEVGRAMLHSGTISIAAIAKRLGVSRDTFYSYFPQARARSQAAAAAAAQRD
jgi:DNA invertase Pin-like site-specific DNA recombinase